mgnify:CR=1 FL=1
MANKPIGKSSMKYNKPEDVVVALEDGKVKVSSLKQYISRLNKTESNRCKVEILEGGLSLWEDNQLQAKCTYYDKPIDSLTLNEILNMYDKDHRLLTTNHCVRFTILMTIDSFISIKDYNGMLIHPRDLYMEEEEYNKYS